MSSKKKPTRSVSTKASAEPKSKTVTAESVIYLGPSITGVVRSSTVFKDGVLPTRLQVLIDNDPSLKKLIVPLSGSVAAVKDLNQNQSALSSIYHSAARKYNN